MKSQKHVVQSTPCTTHTVQFLVCKIRYAQFRYSNQNYKRIRWSARSMFIVRIIIFYGSVSAYLLIQQQGQFVQQISQTLITVEKTAFVLACVLHDDIETHHQLTMNLFKKKIFFFRFSANTFSTVCLPVCFILFQWFRCCAKGVSTHLIWTVTVAKSSYSMFYVGELHDS